MENDKAIILNEAYKALRDRGIVHTQKDFANLLGVGASQLSKAMSGDEKNLTKPLMLKVQLLMEQGKTAVPMDAVSMFPALDSGTGSPQEEKVTTLPIIPIEAMAGSLGEFSQSVSSYDCERMVSPIVGADFAMKVTGDSMTPEYPEGCQVLIKKVNEKAFIEWGKVYVLDTCNGAVIKQIRQTDKEGVIECVSLNQKYAPFTIDANYINGWYRVLMVLSLK